MLIVLTEQNFLLQISDSYVYIIMMVIWVLARKVR